VACLNSERLSPSEAKPCGRQRRWRRSAIGGTRESLCSLRAFLRLTDTVEKLDFLPRSQFLRRQAGFKKKALRVFGRKADFSVCGGRIELAMATRGAICPA
jgi:hypothetical protein